MEVLSRYEPIVEDFEAFLAACERPLPSVVRVNTVKAGVERTKRALDEEGVGYEGREWNPGVLELDTDKPGNTWPYFHGWIHGQEEISSLPATVLAPEPGERVLDACAAPGGKTAQIAALMDDTGLVVANDNNLGRLSALRFNAERLGLTNVAVTRQDARNFSLKPFGFDAFDRVLVDAPCSCEGIIRKRPDTLEEWSLSHVEGVSGVQKGILKRAIQSTRSGGTVVYSTCTFAPEENEAVLDHVLENENCRVVGFDTPLESRSGVTEWNGEEYDGSVEKARRYYPHHNDTGGFFCAKLEVAG
ncbi:RsmB/NOP family class I SAM-dependent RNA methyltransferase [Halalkalicoccus sp. NIPERK01]|uniref:RsmB/NOP family class I SAM-dependent RNA methyltransferase n=1 Tax=Halalkalicoccus sp. NIPERK01 TaxID=3053469 RepID=UPI00256EAECC|nr:RsmB/NOP family class I SAM-dependent RNA methyltransferase [Halalkalicoccus sp. NIPERK01]MDL5361598.1 RsmB/NOP family class I SAM-dependent RNA methyltransferase [Halalkalicoccus sp. NIPERK01]